MPTSKWIIAACAALAVSLPASAVLAISSPVKPAASSRSSASSMRDLGQSAMAKFDTGDFAGARADYLAIAHHPDFAALPAEARHGIYRLAAYCADELEAYADGLEYLKAAAQEDPTAVDDQYWVEYLFMAWGAENPEEGARGLISLSQISPERLNTLTPEFMYPYMRFLKDSETGDVLRYKALAALWEAGYTPKGPPSHTEGLWWGLFEYDVEANNTTRATHLATRFNAPATILSVRLDNRYRPFAMANAQQFDYARAQSANIERAQADMKANPAKLAYVQDLSYSLIEAGRAAEALPLLDAAIVTMNANPGYFEDEKDSGFWLYDTRSRALDDLGRHEEALSSLIEGEKRAGAEDAVSLKINLAGYYNELGRPADTLATLSDFDPAQASPYGVLSAESVRACAYSELGQTARVEETLAAMRPISEKGLPPFMAALACVGAEEELAAFIVTRLDDADTRSDMLVQVQTYLPEPFAGPLEQKAAATVKAAIARPEVQAAVAKYGVIESIPSLSSIF